MVDWRTRDRLVEAGLQLNVLVEAVFAEDGREPVVIFGFAVHRWLAEILMLEPRNGRLPIKAKSLPCTVRQDSELTISYRRRRKEFHRYLS